jgi:CheY-like chemotaxis protein
MTATDKARVLLVDDNQEILDRATAILSSACAVVGAVKDGPAALEAVKALRPDVVVLDISLPGMSGLEVAGRLRRGGSTARIVFLTVYDDEDLREAARAAGGIGYVAKTMLPSDLPLAVNEACAGRCYVSHLR